ncbi:hypothetical protein ACWEJ6_42385 [Nonomuraea sp. NPDC004702]
MADPPVAGVGAGEPLFDRADAAGGQAGVAVHDQDPAVGFGQLLPEDPGERVAPVVIGVRGVEEVAAEVVEEQRPQADEFRNILLRCCSRHDVQADVMTLCTSTLTARTW